MTSTRPPQTKVEPSLHPLEAILTSQRNRRLARKWPWSWRCTTCDDAYGVTKTRADALGAAQQHETAAHPATIRSTP